MADLGNLAISVLQTGVDATTFAITTASTLASKYAIAFSPILLETPVLGEFDLATISFALGVLTVIPNANQTISDAKAAGTDFALYVQGKGSLATVGADLGKISLDVGALLARQEVALANDARAVNAAVHQLIQDFTQPAAPPPAPAPPPASPPANQDPDNDGDVDMY